MQATIEKLVPGGQGLATLENGKKAFIWGALPGELVEFEITKDKKSYCEGIATKIIETAPERAISTCGASSTRRSSAASC